MILYIKNTYKKKFDRLFWKDKLKKLLFLEKSRYMGYDKKNDKHLPEEDEQCDKSEFVEVMIVKIVEVKDRTTELVEQLLNVWESSVRATHLFLSDNEICNIRNYVPQAIKGVPVLIVAENESGNPVGFMGIADKMLEMLFVSSESRGQGIGKQLLQYGIETCSVNELSVNEQNPLAKGFYEYMGFEVYKRTELDEQGNPYPLLYMRRHR